MVEEEVGGERVHALTPEEDEVVAAFDWDVDGVVGIGSVSPPDGAVLVAQGEGEGGCAGIVEAVYGELAGVGNGRGKGLQAGEAAKQEKESSGNPISL